MMRPRIRRLGWAPLLLALLMVLLAPTSYAAVDANRGGQNPGTYSNPLEPEIPGDGVVESCADPNVIRGQQPNDTNWYLFCTTDPLNDEDLDADGNLVFHRIPMMTSPDLVNWTYAGDAFETLPTWAEPDAALWAPDVVYDATHDRYYLFFVVTDTTAAISGVDDCNGDNAIGVATSSGPIGPWTFSDQPVVGPRQNGPGCDFFWTFDPDVLGDAVDGSSILYYGSYYGGIFGDQLSLAPNGASVADEPKQVTIDNKYEGANVVYRDGYYYLFISATNCCNGPLTGYSVYAGRSTDPLGPYVDREGNSLLDAQTGGTPVISMNGNRWVGTGHNTVFQDAAGDWWTIYHAVDRQDPYFETAPGFTKRPALLDAIDWVDGWPTVNGGRWASNRRVPAPAGQEGEKSRHRVRLVASQEPGRLLPRYSDDFDSSLLDDAWSWVREDAVTYRLEDGTLSVDIQVADLYVHNNTASVLVRGEAPRRDYVMETRLRVDIPDEGCCFNFAQAGILVYGDDDNFVKLTNTSIWNTRQTEWAKELAPMPPDWPRYGNTVVGPPSEEWTYLRIVVEHLRGVERREAGGDTEAYTAYTSQDGRTWVRGGTWTHSLGRDARIGLVAMGLQPELAGDFTAEFDYVRVSTLKERRGS